MTAWRLIALAAFLVLGSEVHAEDMVIPIENFTFNPAGLTIKPGTMVTWTNADDIPHSVVEDGPSSGPSRSTPAKHSQWRSRMLERSAIFADCIRM
jgi:plastocyanin